MRERGSRAQELTHQGDDEREDVQQSVQDFGCAFGLIPEDAVNQQGLRGVRKGTSGPPATGSEETAGLAEVICIRAWQRTPATGHGTEAELHGARRGARG